MKIIANGKDKVYTTTCKKCNSDLAYTDADIFYTTKERKGGVLKTVSHLFKPDEYYVNVYLEKYKCIKCPVCGHVIKFIDFDDFLSKKTVKLESVD